MPLKRLSGLFKRKKQKEEVEQAEEERKAIIGEMSENFQNMGSTMDQVQDHLQISTESMQHLPQLIQEQQELCRQVTTAQEASQNLLAKVQEYFEQRDQAQVQVVEQMAAMNQEMKDNSVRQQEHFSNLVQSFKSGRRILVFTIAIMGVISTCLLTVLVILAIRPDLFGARGYQAPIPQSTTTANPFLIEASQSSDPAIRQRALEALQKQ